MMHRQYGIITPDIYYGSMRKAGPYVLADWPWILAHMDPDGLTDVSAWVLADEIGGELAEHQKALDWLLRPDPNNEWQECDGCRLMMVDRSSYYVVNHLQYRSLCQSIKKAEYNRAWDHQNRPSGWQREKAKRISPNQSD